MIVIQIISFILGIGLFIYFAYMFFELSKDKIMVNPFCMKNEKWDNIIGIILSLFLIMLVFFPNILWINGVCAILLSTFIFYNEIINFKYILKNKNKFTQELWFIVNFIISLFLFLVAILSFYLGCTMLFGCKMLI